MAESVMRIAGENIRPMPRKLGFTVSALEHATCPADKERVTIYDARTPGLAVRITPAGAKTFILYRKVNGRPQRVRLGGFPEIAIEQARKLATAASGDIAKGVDPMAEKRQARTRGMNIGQLWDWYLENHAKPRKRSYKDDEQRYKMHIKPTFEHRPIDKLSRVDVAALHRKIALDHAPATANRVLALLSVMYSKARMIAYEGGNPCKGVERFRETSRDRFLTHDELPMFFAALDDEQTPTMWQDYFRLLLLTGARSANVKAMRWDELDLSSGTWRISAANAKAGEALVVHLPAEAVEILKTRKNGKEWVFPSSSKSGHVITGRKAWGDLLERAKLKGLRMHDLRRTLGSWMAAGGSSLHVIGKTLGHRAVQTTQIYARLQMDPVRHAVDAATNAMKAAVEAAKQEQAKQ